MNAETAENGVALESEANVVAVRDVVVYENLGLLPNIKDIEALEKILPGSAQKILDMVENEQRFETELRQRLISLERFKTVVSGIAYVLVCATSIAGSVFVFSSADEQFELFFALAFIAIPVALPIVVSLLSRKGSIGEENDG